MEAIETLAQYYEMTCRKLPVEWQRGNGLSRHFNVFIRKSCLNDMPFVRRDYYKISLCRGWAVLYTERGEVEITRPAIFFSSPMAKFGWRNISETQEGYVCLFNEQFLTPELKKDLMRLMELFKDEVYPFVALTDDQYERLCHFFGMIAAEYNEGFEYKEEMILSLLKVLLLTAMKIRLSRHPLRKLEKQDALVSRFLDLLEAQFPVDAPHHPILLTTPGDFARRLHIHVNHLNHLIKHYTGKPTSRIIMEKRLAEAISLLRNTDWTIAEIASSLGFDYPQYFHSFFKKQTGVSPRDYRRQIEANI